MNKKQNLHPLVSIAIITYNHARFIENAIKSVLSQDYPNIEIIISDDASGDNTLAIVDKYAKKYSDKIKVLSAENNIGAAGNWLKCASHCQGKYIVGLAGDDEFLPQIISKQVKIMESDPDIAICYADAVVFDVPTQKKLYLLSDKIPAKSGGIQVALRDSIYYSPATMFRKELVPKENIFKGIKHGTDLAFYKELIIIAGPAAKIQYLPEVLYKYQKHEANITVTQSGYRRDHIEAIKILQKKYPEYYNALNPSIYDFACVAFFKSVAKLKLQDSFYFLSIGLKASHYNPFKFFRALMWGIKFYLRFLLQKL
jgi:glycosyltransferase involved in cell wall biosynthesis